MKNKNSKFVWVFLLCMGSSTWAQDVEHVLWDKTPIHISLPLNQERLVRFPKAVSIVDSELENEHLSVMKFQDSLYLNAKENFTNKRLIVQLMPDGEAIVLNISARSDIKNCAPIDVLVPDNEHKEAISSNQEVPEKRGEGTLNPISLTRFAIQSLYSPERLLITPPGVTRTPMHTHRTISLVYGASVLATPLISWKGEGLYVTAVVLKNELNKPITLDPRNLIGDWQTAAFYPTNILNARGKDDTTTVFVTSARPFAESLSLTREYVR